MAELARLAGWRRVAGLAAVEVAGAGVPLAIVAAIGVLVGRVTTAAGIAVPLAVLSGLLLAQQLLVPVRAALAYRVTREIDGQVRARVAAAANRPPSVAALEDPEVLDRLVLAGGDTDKVSWHVTPGGGLVAFVTMGGRYLQGLGAAVLVAQVSVPLAVVLATTVVLIRRQCRTWTRVRILAIRRGLTNGRAGRYTSNLASTPPTAKEARLFGLLDWLLERHQGEWAAVTATRTVPGWWCTRRMVALLLASGPVLVGAFYVLGRWGLDGRIDARSLTIALQAAIALGNLLDLREEVFQVDFGMDAFDELRRLEAELGAPGTVAAGAVPAGDLPTRSIRFSGVGFAYPGGRRVFDGLDLTIPAGSSLAVVGANGAGKTTLVKLLGRLYEPDAGAILVDGIPLAELDLASWRCRLAVIFQDFVRYQLTVAENVGFGGLDRLGERAALAAAAIKAGASTVVERLPAGWDTPLGRQYKDGAELSGGEWQRVALARALFAVEAGAGVLVLDEPTANLDVRAEAELFDRFLDLTRGLTTILISHRFSTVRRADRICVLEHGRVVELGSHDDLLAARGRYAELFGLQAARFDG